jgi:glycyl-tRNA synthetase
MAFIVKKNISGNDYYYLNENKREGDKVKTKTLAYLGKTKEEAEKKMKEFLERKENKKEEIPEERSKLVRKDVTMEELTNFCKRKGFVFQSAEIYGGFAGFWDYGPLGVELYNNIKKSWRQFFIRNREDIVEINGSIITSPKVWEASGHVGNFKDVAVKCKKCKKFSKVDQHEIKNAVCDFCGGDLDRENAKELQQMFTTNVGPIEDTSIKSYLRPETAQLIFTNFKQVSEISRMKLPFGIAQIGKAFRNEIAPRNFLFRNREFEQMEIEYFISPGESCPYKIPKVNVLIFSSEMQEKNKNPEYMNLKEAFKNKIIKRDWHVYWLSQVLSWFNELGCNMGNFRLRQHGKEELAHYSSDCWDVEYKFPFGWKELTGIADRGDYDLSQHEKHSKKDLKLFVEGKGKVLPQVIAEPSFGVERAFLVLLNESYYYDEKRKNIILKIKPKFSPINVAVLPIVKGKEYEKISQELLEDLRKEWSVSYDKSGSIGRRYSRNDEIGTPFCLTIDEKTLINGDVTLRDRDTTKQIRVKIKNLKNVLRDLIDGKIKFNNL